MKPSIIQNMKRSVRQVTKNIVKNMDMGTIRITNATRNQSNIVMNIQ